MQHYNSESDAAVLTWPQPDDEETMVRKRRSEPSFIRGFRLLVTIIGLGYVTLGAFYIKLRIEYTGLLSEVRSSKAELFPSISTSKAFRNENRKFALAIEGTPFAGAPNPELDHAWHELLENTTIRVSGEDLAYYNVTSLPLADGSGFASQMFIAHELHCLKKVRQWTYKEAYFADVQGMARNELSRHIDHCIETLRQGIMCRGDVSLGTYTYLSGGGNDVTARNWASHHCVDFSSLMGWTKAHAVNIFADGVLVKPEDLGPEHFTQRSKPH